MNSDCAFFIGSGHKICQDYAVSGSAGDTRYVILADGCSSSPDTDIGARLLVKSAQTFIHQVHGRGDARENLRKFHQQSIQFAQLCGNFLHLDTSSLDATLLTVTASERRFIASCYGDGVVALGRRDGRLDVYSINFSGGFPRYLSYTLDAAKGREFAAETSNRKEVTQYLLPPSPNPNPIVNVRVSTDAIEIFSGNRDDYRFVAVISDGIHSFHQLEWKESTLATTPVPITEIVPQLLHFRRGTLDFVYRRMLAFNQLCQTRNWQHEDDLSIGVVHLGDPMPVDVGSDF
jgi:hypothetical protein